MQYKKMICQHSFLQIQQQLKLVFGLLIRSKKREESHLSILFSSDESFKDNILEKQADLIRYLRERNDQLTRLIHQSHRT